MREDQRPARLAPDPILQSLLEEYRQAEAENRRVRKAFEHGGGLRNLFRGLYWNI